MYCMKCGKKIDDDSNFCDGCGARVVQFEAEEPVKETPETVAEAVTEAEPETEAEAVTETVPEAEAEPETAPEPVTEAEPEPVTETEPEAEAEVTPEKAPEVVPEAEPETATETVSEASPNAKPENLLTKLISLLPKDKKKRTILGGISIVLVLVIIFSSAFGGGGKNEFVVETGIDDIYGGVAFDLTLDEFIDKYNSCVEANKEYDLAAEFDKLNIDNFKKIASDEGTSAYAYSFGYTTGTFPMAKFHTLGILSIIVNDTTQKIQGVKYFWQADNYNSEQAKNNYHYTIPARIFSMVHSEIDFPYNDDYSSYYDFLKNYYDGKDVVVLEGDTMYGVPHTGSDDMFGFEMIAATDDSELYKITKSNIS